MYIEIDGSAGEGGGQILRTSLAMSALLKKPIHIKNIRAGRREPGLQAQHLTCVNALAKITNAEVKGDFLGSQELLFNPRSIQSGNYKFDVSDVKASAGSVSLVLQAIFLPLALSGGKSKITLLGGTHVPWSPPIHYLQLVYLPMLAKMGINADIKLITWGWYPKGGGNVEIEINSAKLSNIDLTKRGLLKNVKCICAVSNLPISIAQRQKGRVQEILESKNLKADFEIINAPSRGQGTGTFIFAEFDNSIAGFSSLGAKGKRAEQIADEVCEDCFRFLDSQMAIDEHLADQLVPIMALSKGISRFTTSKISLHLLTNIHIAECFLPVKFYVSAEKDQPGEISVEGIGYEFIT
ncbi:MAG: RNA 3'-terminal phosphate cyclase [Candidatus Poribacteria bacterium]